MINAKPLTGITLLNGDKIEVTDIESTIMVEIPRINIIVNGTFTSLTVSPVLPEGISLHRDYMGIFGRSRVALAKTTFSVIASYGNDTVQATFTLTILACQYGSYLYGDGQYYTFFSLTLSKNGKEMFRGDNMTGTHAITACIKADTYDYSFTCLSDKNDCYVRLYDESSMIHGRIDSRKEETTIGKIEMYVNKLPTVVFDQEFFTSHIDTSTMTIIAYGYSSIAVISDSLLNVDYTDGSRLLTVNRPEAGVHHLFLNITNPYGFILKPLTIYSDRCRSDNRFIHYTVEVNDAPYTLQIASTNGTVLTDKSDMLLNHFCVTDGDYDVSLKIIMKDREFIKEKNHFTVVDENWNAIYKSYFQYGMNHLRERIHVAPFIHSDSLLRLSNQFDDLWNKNSFNDAKWGEVKQGDWGKWGSRSTLYFRKSVSIVDPTHFTNLVLSITLREGVAVYVNGEEVYRTGLPEGSISHDTKATVLMEKKQTYTSSFSPSLFRKGMNLIAVELHRSELSLSETVITFSIGLTTITASCHVSRYPGVATSIDSTSKERSASSAFSLSYYDDWRTTDLPITLTYAFINHTTHYFNQVTIVATSLIKMKMPANFTVVGVRDGSEVVLTTVASTALFSVSKGLVTIPLNNHRSYSAYRFHFTAANEGPSISLFHIFFSVCDTRYCPKNRVGVLPVNGYVNKNCPWFKRGVRRVRCERQFASLSVVKDDSDCIRVYPPGSESYIDMSFRITDCSMERWIKYVDPAMKKVVSQQLIVREDQVLFTAINDYSNITSFTMGVSMRFRIEAEIGDYVFKHMNSLMTNITVNVQKAMVSESIGVIYVVEDPVLHGPANIDIIVKVAMVIIYVITLMAFFLFWRRRIGQVGVKSLKKTLKSSKGKLESEKEGLLQQDV